MPSRLLTCFCRRFAAAAALLILASCSRGNWDWKTETDDSGDEASVLEQKFVPLPIPSGSDAFCQAVYVVKHGIGKNILASQTVKESGLATVMATLDGDLSWKAATATTLRVWLRVPRVIVSNLERDGEATRLARGGQSVSAPLDATFLPFAIRQSTDDLWSVESVEHDARLFIHWKLGTALLVSTTAQTSAAGLNAVITSFVCRPITKADR